jgi:CelD/BcsL family acetyltransferase involved in cellulose biosynthesis
MAVLVEEHSDVAALPERVRSLFARRGRENLFLGADWFALLARAGLDPAARPVVLSAFSPAGAPLAALPLARIGRTVQSLSSYYSLLYAPALAEADDDDLSAALAALAVALRGRAALVHLRPMASDDPALPLFDAAFRDAGFLLGRHETAPMRYLDAAGLDGDAFAARLPSRLRNTIRRNAGPRNAGETAFRLFREPAEVAVGMADYTRVYAASWKAAEPFPGFMPELAALCAARGALRLGCWYVDGDPAAAQFWIVHGGGATLYKLAQDPRFDRRSVGSALTLRMFREILDGDRPARIDFGLGDEPFKADWTPCRAGRVGWLAFDPSSAAGLAAAARHRLGRLLRLSRTGNGV